MLTPLRLYNITGVNCSPPFGARLLSGERQVRGHRYGREGDPDEWLSDQGGEGVLQPRRGRKIGEGM